MRRWLAGLIVALYVTAFPYHPKLRSPNELCRLWQSRAWVDFGRLDLNQALRAYGRVGDLAVFQGRYYPSKAPLLSFAAIPIYGVLKALYGNDPRAVPETMLVYFARLFLTVLPTLVMLRFLFRFLRSYASTAVAEGLVLTYAIGSLAFSYSLLFMSHQPTAALVFLSFYALWRCARGEWLVWGYLLAGTLSGAAVMAEYTAALPVLCLSGYGLATAGVGATRRAPSLVKAAPLFLLGAAPWAAALMAYHQACFGGPFESGYRHLADAGYQPWHLGGFLGIRFPDPRAFLLSFFSPLRGLFVLSPFLLLGLWGLRRLRHRERPLFGLTMVLLLGYAYFTSSFAYDSWGWTTGPRHLTPLVPFLLAPAALLLEGLRQRQEELRLRLAAGLCMVSVLTTGLLTGLNYVPDDVSTGLGALALPLFREGFYPPTVFALFSTATWPGALWLMGLLLCAALTAGLLVPPGPASLARRAVLPSVLAAQALLFMLTTRNAEPEENARELLRTAWWVRP